MADTRASHAVARAYLAAVTAGELPDALLTPDMTAWTTTQGTMDKASYQAAIRLLARMCAAPIAFTLDALTAEADRVVIEARSQATLINGSEYRNTYVFVLRLQGDRIAHLAEHFNVLVVRDKLVPLMGALEAWDG